MVLCKIAVTDPYRGAAEVRIPYERAEYLAQAYRDAGLDALANFMESQEVTVADLVARLKAQSDCTFDPTGAEF